MPPIRSRTPPRWVTAAVMLMAFMALLASFWQTVGNYQALPSTDGMLIVFGVPVGAFTMSISSAVIVCIGAMWSRRGFESPRRLPLGIAVLVFGVIGWYAAFALSADKVLTSLDPSTDLDCNVSLLVQCGANLESWQGSVFGFPNSLIGLVCWAAVIVVGCVLLAGVRVAPWYWIAFNVGLAGALALVIWLIGQSIFVLGTLCPWCMVTWAVTIPLFWAVTLHNAAEGRFGGAAGRILGPAFSWVPAITVASYIVIAIVAQAQLDILAYL